MTKEERVKRVQDYLGTEKCIEDFCDRVIKEYLKYDNLENDVHVDVSSFKVDERTIWIETEHTFWHETDHAYIEVPLDVFYNNNVAEYVKNLSEERAKEEEQAKKRKEESERRCAAEEIKRLKEKYNL